MIEYQKIGRGEFDEFWLNDYLAKIEFLDGWKMCFNEKGSLHCENGPAVIKPDGTQFWYQHGLLHRENGPAVIRTNGDVEYWIRGENKNL